MQIITTISDMFGLATVLAATIIALGRLNLCRGFNYLTEWFGFWHIRCKINFP